MPLTLAIRARPIAFGEGASNTTQLWIPYTLGEKQRTDREQASVDALARLAPGFTLNGAQAELSNMSPAWSLCTMAWFTKA